MSVLIEKELPNGVLVKVYTYSHASEEEKKISNYFSRAIIDLEIKNTKVVIDFEDEIISIFDTFDGKKSLIDYNISKIDRAISFCKDREGIEKLLSSLNGEDRNKLYHYLKLKENLNRK